MDIETKIRRNTLIKTRTAVIFGALAGVIYSAVAWGIDGYQLSQSNAILPWTQFIIGAVMCGLLGALAGWLTYRLNNIFLTFIIWAVTGMLFAWIGNHMQFTLYPLVMRMVSPALAGQMNFQMTEAIRAAQFLVWAAVTGLCVLGGMLFVNQVEGAVESAGILGPLLPILVMGVIFSFAGFAVRDNLTQQMSEPVVGANRHIQMVLESEGKTLDQKAANRLRLSAFDDLQDLLHRPRRLALVGYDDMVSDMHVLIDFGGAHVRCSVLGNLINFCNRE